MDYEERLKELEEELRTTKYNKRTQHAIGLLKAKIARLKGKEELERKKSSKTGEGFAVKKTGDATVVIIGFPSVGKSTLLNKLTNAESKTAAYDFTTVECIPGIMEYNKARIQVLDVPGVIEGAASGTGRGKEVFAVLRNADLLMLIIDVNNPLQLKVLERELHKANFRLNQKKPDVRIRRIERGGIRIGTTVKLTKIGEKTIKAVLNEFRIMNAEVLIRENIDVDQLIDVIEDNRKYLPELVVLNKIDLVSEKELNKITNEIKEVVPVSAEKNTNLEVLKEKIFEKLGLIRIYLKQVGTKADLEEPMIMRKGCTIAEVCEKLHKDFIKKFCFARVWGKSAKFPGQKIGLNHKLIDGDILQINLK